MPNVSDFDPKNLIGEAYNINYITAKECRSIFLDWALSLPKDIVPIAAIGRLLTIYQFDYPEHPMTEVLKAGLVQPPAPKRKGGWRARLNRN